MAKKNLEEELNIKRTMPKVADRVMIPTGISLLNLAISDRIDGGFDAGKIYRIAGDRATGKTFFVLNMLATVANDSRFDDYTLILDDAEVALNIDIERLFGKKAYERIKFPQYNKDGSPKCSITIEDFFGNVNIMSDSGNKFIYGLDSIDALTTLEELDRAKEFSKIAKGDKDSISGSYQMDKAKTLNAMLRTQVGALSKTNSLLFFVAQYRDNIGAMAFQNKNKTSGGKAIDFFATGEIALTAKKTIKASYKDHEEEIGKLVIAKILKNKITGKLRSIEFSNYTNYGIDDIGSMVDFLLDYGVIKKKGAYCNASALGLGEENVYAKSIIEAIENDIALYQKTKDLCQETWNEKENALALERKPRFAE